MAFPKILVVTVALVALAGFGVAAVAPEAIIGQEEEPLSFTVPLSRVGDRVVYEVYSATNHSTPQDHDHHGGGPHTYQTAFEIAHLGTTTDWNGKVRDVAVVKSSIRLSGDQEAPTVVLSVDREERIGVRSAVIWPESAEGSFRVNASLAFPTDPRIPFVDVQGKRLGLDDEIPLAPMLRGEGGGYGAGGGGGVYLGLLPEVQFSRVNLAFRTPNDPLSVEELPRAPGTVRHQGTVDDQPALMLASSRVETVQRSGHGGHGGDVLEIQEETLAWFTPEVPYPVLIETTILVRDMEGTLVSSTGATRWLSVFEPGTGPAAWGPAHEREPVVLERTTGQHYPGDGHHTTIAYPLSQALADIEAFPPPEALVWHDAHPEAILVSARMTPGSHDGTLGTSLEWQLTFAEPTGAGFRVLTERFHNTPTPYVESLRETETRPFVASDLPVAPVTFGQAESFWRNDRPETPVTYAHWGLPDVWHDTSQSCLVTTSHRSGYDDLSTADALATLIVGSADWGPCLPADNRHEMTGVFMDASRGLLLASFALSYEVEEHGQVPMGFPIGPGKATVTSPTDAGAPTVVLSSLASSSLLLIIITVYLLPHIKWFGTQALLVVPGFSKLKKDKLLDHKLREQLNETIKSNPGISPSELQRQTGAGWGTIVHHLSIMEKNGLVTSAIDGRHRRYFPPMAGGEPAARRQAVLGNDNTQRVLSLVTAEPGIPTSAIANELGMSTAGAMWHLGRLTEAGFVDRRKEGRSVRYFPDQAPLSPARVYDPKEAVEVV